jgi:hypothetical protein
MPLVQTRGAASAQGFGEFAQVTAANYIEDVFSTYLYTGNGATQTITNGIDLSANGGLVWFKSRSQSTVHSLFDTARGVGRRLNSASTAASENISPGGYGLNAFNSNGFTIKDTSIGDYEINGSSYTYASWTFREQPKFFDIVTYTGTGSNATISHNLGSEPGCIIVKRTDAAGQNWYVYHRGASSGNKYLILNRTDTEDSGFFWTPTSTTFNVSSTLGLTANGGTYVCYLFAHDAGGFGLTGTDNVISCGSFSCDGTGAATVSLGWEPQFILTKSSSFVSRWVLADTFRGLFASANCNMLVPNTSEAESPEAAARITSTGFTFLNGNYASQTGIYIAIRRGPMKVPTTGTSVFTPIARAGTNSVANVTSGFATDLFINLNRDHLYFANNPFFDRLRGLFYSSSNSVAAESSGSPFLTSYDNTSVTLTNSGLNSAATTYITYSMLRAPGFFDEVCYTGTGSNRTVAHNLTVIPELMIFKVRSTTDGWQVYCSALDVTGGSYLLLSDSATAQTNGSTRFTGAPTSTLINLATNGSVNGSGSTYVAYLFATLAGVSKVGGYTGTGALQTVNCGFTTGARFVLIKRSNSTGDWYVWDSARGISSGNDPYLLLNNVNAEVTGTNYVDTDTTGFKVTAAAPAALNAVGGTYIFLAIA